MIKALSLPTKFLLFYLEDHGIRHGFSAVWTPQQNGVAERRNRTLKEAARTLIVDYNVSQNFGLKRLIQHAILRTDL